MWGCSYKITQDFLPAQQRAIPKAGARRRPEILKKDRSFYLSFIYLYAPKTYEYYENVYTMKQGTTMLWAAQILDISLVFHVDWLN